VEAVLVGMHDTCLDSYYLDIGMMVELHWRMVMVSVTMMVAAWINPQA
jgi:hypothetical protein